jgi:glutamine cyclotransferase
VSSGNYGKSRLMRFNLEDGSLDAEHRLDPRLFAEGVTVLGDRVYQLTWRAGLMLIYDREELKVVERWRIPGQGWGLTNNGRELIYSDGSASIHFVAPEARKITRSIEVREAGAPVERLNELEWIDGRIWANVWQTDRIVIIDPDSGEVEGTIDLAGLLPASERRADTDVLNGIARDPADGSVWVTGKRWPAMYRIEIQPITPTSSREETGPHSAVD